MTIVAASSGNTGAALAMIAAMRGYKAIVTINQKCSAEKIYATLVISPRNCNFAPIRSFPALALSPAP